MTSRATLWSMVYAAMLKEPRTPTRFPSSIAADYADEAVRLFDKRFHENGDTRIVGPLR